MQTYMLTNLLTMVHYNIAHTDWHVMPQQPQLTIDPQHPAEV
jgi:hypothetical protein